MSGYNNSYYSPGYTAPSGYPPSNNFFKRDSFKPVNALEIATIVLAILALIGVFVWGLMVQNTLNRDKQRQQDIDQILIALEDFYENSSTVPSQRFYPKSICSESLNEVDFEFTLRRNLTGLNPQVDSHIYIQPNDFPKDLWGNYSQTFGQRQIPYRCPEKVNFGNIANNQNIYSDGYSSCNFNQARKLFSCYLYTSSNSGDTFRLGYYKESDSKIVVYRKFRQDRLIVESNPA